MLHIHFFWIILKWCLFAQIHARTIVITSRDFPVPLCSDQSNFPQSLTGRKAAVMYFWFTALLSVAFGAHRFRGEDAPMDTQTLGRPWALTFAARGPKAFKIAAQVFPVWQMLSGQKQFRHSVYLSVFLFSPLSHSVRFWLGNSLEFC